MFHVCAYLGLGWEEAEKEMMTILCWLLWQIQSLGVGGGRLRNGFSSALLRVLGLGLCWAPCCCVETSAGCI